MRRFTNHPLKVYLLMLTFVMSLWAWGNLSAPNPTGRYFSSQAIDLTQDSKVFGEQAEAILSQDLGIVQNDSPDGAHICFCNREVPLPASRCQICEVTSVRTTSLPDFVTEQVIADSKAVKQFNSSAQIESFIEAAYLTDRQVWIFVRDDTQISPTILARVQATGGDIVPYFVTGTSLLLLAEQGLNQVILIVLIIGAGITIWQLFRYRQSQINLPPEQTHNKIDQAQDSIEETEEFMRRMERLSKPTIKKEDDD